MQIVQQELPLSLRRILEDLGVPGDLEVPEVRQLRHFQEVLEDQRFLVVRRFLEDLGVRWRPQFLVVRRFLEDLEVRSRLRFQQVPELRGDRGVQ